MTMEFKTEFEPHYGKAVKVADNVHRLTVNNPGPFTFHGTNSYLIGKNSLAILDPGPEDDTHFEALLEAIADRPVTHILVSHTHMDHSPLARRLKEKTGAPIYAEGPHRPARTLRTGEINPLDAAADTAFSPDIALADGDVIEGDGWAVTAIHTPGHTANHTVFGLEQGSVLFSADHVMGWATSIVAPPDGAMADYMASLERLLERDDALLLPGHGGVIDNPQPFLRGLRAHRKMRERAVIARLEKGDRLISDMVRAIYAEIDPRLHGAAALSVLAHIEDLVARQVVETVGEVSIEAEYGLK